LEKVAGRSALAGRKGWAGRSASGHSIVAPDWEDRALTEAANAVSVAPVSFVVMRRLRLTEAFPSDNFRAAGYRMPFGKPCG
jgi:hypothetical protein